MHSAFHKKKIHQIREKHITKHTRRQKKNFDTSEKSEEDRSVRHTSLKPSNKIEPGLFRPQHMRKRNKQADMSIRHTSLTEQKTKQKNSKRNKNKKMIKEDVSIRHGSTINKEGGKLSVYYTNADTLSNKINILAEQVHKMKPHIICVTEVKPKNYRYALQSCEIKIQGYTLYENLSEQGRGICIYIDEKLSAIQTDIETYGSEECIWIEIKGEGQENLIVGCVYRSPNSSEENNLKINKMVQNLDCSKKILMMGDFNYKEIVWSDPDNVHATEPKAELFLESTRDSFLYQHIQEPTRHRGEQKRNILDLVFTTDDSADNIQLNPPLGNSDHCSIVWEVEMNFKVTEQAKKYFNYNKANYSAMKEDILAVDWQSNLSNKNVEEAWNTLHEKLEATCRKNIPISEPKKGRKRPLWMNKTALAKVKKKHEAWKRYLQSESGEAYLEYTRARNQAKWHTRKAQRIYEQKIAKEAKKNPKQFWSYVNSKRKSQVNIPDLDITDDKNPPKTTNDDEKAELLNQYFKKVFTDEDLQKIPNAKKKRIENTLKDIEITQEEVLKRLKALNQNKSPGPDNIHPRILKELSHELSLPLTLIFKKSLENGNLPKSWKDGHIMPIFKKGNKHKVENYRPVCLTSICCKILESIIREKIMVHLIHNKLISKNQHGFLIGRSTLTQLIETLEEWTSMLDKNDNLDVLYCDFKKAFDSVPHKRLMVKINSFGIEGNVGKWIENFITGRRQRVCIKDSKSTWVDVTSGVPQGSVLGPLLFVLYINDLPEAITCLSKLYADDTKIYQAVNNAKDAEIFQENIKQLWNWSIEWQLHFHPDKCHILHLGKANIEKSYYMGAGDMSPHTHLKSTDEEKDLGVVVDNQLKFSSHCDKIVNTANKLLGIMRRAFSFLDRTTFSLVYKGIIRPVIEYASTVYSPLLMKDVNKLESIQRRATKMVIGMKEKTYEERLKYLDLPTLRYRRMRGDMINVFKYLHELYWVDAEKLLPLNKDMRTRGHKYKLQSINCNSRARLHFFTQRVVNKWNSLSNQTVTATSVNSFKNRLDKEWMNKDGKYNFNSSWFDIGSH